LVNKFKTTGLVLDKKIKNKKKLTILVQDWSISQEITGKSNPAFGRFSLLSKNCYKITETSPILSNTSAFIATTWPSYKNTFLQLVYPINE
jgi:hypothetical protein